MLARGQPKRGAPTNNEQRGMGILRLINLIMRLIFRSSRMMDRGRGRGPRQF